MSEMVVQVPVAQKAMASSRSALQDEYPRIWDPRPARSRLRPRPRRARRIVKGKAY